MKHIFLIFCSLVSFMSLSAQTGKFSIDLKAEGLVKGDTIIIERTDVNNWEAMKSDTIQYR